jgi:hypothetical protein
MSIRVESTIWELETSTITTMFAVGVRLQREPLGEMESANLYTFCENNPTNGFDVLGLAYMQIRPLEQIWPINKTTIGKLYHASFKLDKPIYKYGEKFYDDFGYYDDNEVRPDIKARDNVKKLYKNIGPHLDDETLLEAKALVDPNYDQIQYPDAPEYHLITVPFFHKAHNCQCYAKDVMDKYNELMAKKEKALLDEPSSKLPANKSTCPKNK